MATKQASFQDKFAPFLYRWRWALTAAVVGVVLLVFALGVSRVGTFSSSVAGISDTSDGTGEVKPIVFNPSLDIWFGEKDETVLAYYEIEDRFVAEDYVLIAFEVPDREFGVFDREALDTTRRLTEKFLTIPGVRHVRSLTYNPWIRWGNVTEDEEGLIISDLVEEDPADLSDNQIIERMIAILGAERAAERVGDEKVRAVLGKDADYANHIGEPLLLGTIVNDAATTTVIQIQVLRPRIDEEDIAAAFPDENDRAKAPLLHSIARQRTAIRGIEHILRVEQGLAVPTADHARLAAWIGSLPEGEGKEALLLELSDPTRNFMKDADGALVQKYAEPAGAPEPRSPFEFHMGGIPLFERNFEEVGMGDAIYIPLMFLAIIIVLFLVFRSISGVIVPLTVVFASIMGMVGVTFLMGDLFNNLTMMAPNMLTAVGLADAIHLVTAWVILRSKYDDKKTLITEVIRRNALPVFLTSLTTAIGVYSLTTSALIPVQMLGSMVALGTFFAWALSMTLVPALLSLVPHRKTVAPRASRVQRLFSEERSARFVDLVTRRRIPILVGTALLFVLAIVGLLNVEIDSDFRAMFPEDNKTISDFTWTEDRMGGVGDLELVFTGIGKDAPELTEEEEDRLEALALREQGVKEHPDEFKPLSGPETYRLAQLRAKYDAWNESRIGISPRFLAALDAFEARLRREMADPASPLAVISDLTSPLDILRKMHQVQHENQAEAYRVPNEADVPEELATSTLTYDEWTEEWSLTPGQSASNLIAQYYLQYESGARPGEALTTQLSADRSQFRMQGRVRQASSTEHLVAFERVQEIVQTEFPELEGSLSDFTLSGKSALNARTMELFSIGFMKSLILAVGIITILIGIIFRSVRFAFLSLIPNVLPILIPLSAFGLLGWALDGPAILVSSIALGVCVDDTIHFFTKYSRARRKGMDARAALTHSISEAGTALTVTTIVLVIGFATLMLSDFSPNFQMGALAGLMIAFAWVADFFVTVALLSFEGKRVPVSKDSKTKGGLAMKTATVITVMFLAISIGWAQDNKTDVKIPDAPKFTKDNADTYGKEIALYVDKYDAGWVDEVMVGKMTLYDADGDSVRRKFLRKSLEGAKGDKNIFQFLSPAEIKGVAALTHENSGSSDDNWLYLPATKRVRRISGANNTASFQGTEFTYEDLATIDPHEYKWRFIEEATLVRGKDKQPVYKLDAKPTYKDTGYSRVTVYVNRTTWQQERIEYYDKAGRLMKTRDSSDWRHIHGRFWRPGKIDMKNHQTGKRTLLEQDKWFVDLSMYTSRKTGKNRPNLTASQFTKRALQK